MNTEFDIVVCGGGMAGLSLLWYLKQDGYQGNLALIDSFEDQRMDRTWSYWSKTPGAFDHLSYAQWNQAKVVSHQGQELLLSLNPYSYFSISGKTFHTYVMAELKEWRQLQIIRDHVIDCKPGTEMHEVHTASATYRARVLFDSTFKPNFNLKHSRYLLQHFLGYVITCAEPCFDAHCPELMNFKVQESVDCHFVYVLPQSNHKALVEYTVFSEKVLSKEEYKSGLKNWLDQKGIGSFEIEEIEAGVIPMSDARIEVEPYERFFRIGTSGGFTNPATGYTFYNTQKILRQWSKELVKGDHLNLKSPLWNGRFGWYYGTLLEVLNKRMLPAHEVFFRLYQKNKTSELLDFLNAESGFTSELRIMASTRILVFIRAGAKVFFDLLKGSSFFR